MRYSLAHLRRGFEDPKLILRECNRLYHTRLRRQGYNHGGIDIFEQSWDNLVILDACRYDMFAAANPFDGELTRRESRGSSTREFLQGNFAGRTLNDTVYVTANPQFELHRDSLDTTFHDVVNVWTEAEWDEENGTIHPETMTRYAAEAAQRYPHKRLIFHYIQPHYPFIDAETSFDKGQLRDNPRGLSFWDRCMLGHIDLSPDRLDQLYRDNLALTLPYVEELVDDLAGLTVVTADHGNMIADRSFPLPIREWGHPPGIHDGPLVEVPWLVLPVNERRETTADAAEATADETDHAHERLEHLGYV